MVKVSLKFRKACSKTFPVSTTLPLSPLALQLAPLSYYSTEMFGEAAANMKSNLRGNNYSALPKMQESLCPADSSAIPACLFTETRIEGTREGGSRIPWCLATDRLKIIPATPISHHSIAHHRSQWKSRAEDQEMRACCFPTFYQEMLSLKSTK